MARARSSGGARQRQGGLSRALPPHSAPRRPRRRHRLLCPRRLPANPRRDHDSRRHHIRAILFQLIAMRLTVGRGAACDRRRRCLGTETWTIRLKGPDLDALRSDHSIRPPSCAASRVPGSCRSPPLGAGDRHGTPEPNHRQRRRKPADSNPTATAPIIAEAVEPTVEGDGLPPCPLPAGVCEPPPPPTPPAHH